MRFLLAVLAAVAAVAFSAAPDYSSINRYLVVDDLDMSMTPSPTPSPSGEAPEPSAPSTPDATPLSTPAASAAATGLATPAATQFVEPSGPATPAATQFVEPSGPATPAATQFVEPSGPATPASTANPTLLPGESPSPSETRSAFRTPFATRTSTLSPGASRSAARTPSSSASIGASATASSSPLLRLPSSAPSVDPVQLEAYKEVKFDFQIPNVTPEDVTNPSVIASVTNTFASLLGVPEDNVVIDGYDTVEVESRRRRRARLLQVQTAVVFRVSVRTTPTTPAPAAITASLQAALAAPTVALATIVNAVSIVTGLNPADLVPVISNVEVQTLGSIPEPEQLEDVALSRRLKLGFGIAFGIVAAALLVVAAKKACAFEASRKAAQAAAAAQSGAAAAVVEEGAKASQVQQAAAASEADGRQLVQQKGLDAYKSSANIKQASRAASRRNSATKATMAPMPTGSRTEV